MVDRVFSGEQCDVGPEGFFCVRERRGEQFGDDGMES